MPDLNALAVLTATAAAFLLSFGYYAALSPAGDAAEEQPPPWKLGVGLLRSLVLATVLAGLAVEAGVDEAAGGLVPGVIVSVWR
jgi:hypothetical protein